MPFTGRYPLIVCTSSLGGVSLDQVTVSGCAGTLEREGNTIYLTAEASAVSPTLLHRWSFNGDYTDSVGGLTGTDNGSSVTFVNANTAISLAGGNKGTSWVDLNPGKNPAILPLGDAPFTIEMWTTLRAITTYSAWFTLGRKDSTGTRGLMVAFHNTNAHVRPYNSSTGTGPAFQAVNANGGEQKKALGLWTLDKDVSHDSGFFGIMCAMQTVNKDSNDFGEIRREGYVYVDKTAWFHRLASAKGEKMFFLARPRRFGKSLMISTLEAMFQGRRELFEGLAIMDTDWNWKKKYPVIHLNMGMCAAGDYMEFKVSLPKVMKAALERAGVEYDPSELPSMNFGSAIDDLSAKGTPPVILIDEYDDPVAQALKNPDDAERVRDALAPVYRQMKDRSGKIRFLMITGVSKFTQLSVFSALSSLVDISFEDAYASMLGYTEDELDRYFSEHMEAHRKVMKLSAKAYRAEIKRLYNGYRFWRFTGENVYNPVSINLTMANRLPQFELYWTKTGKASFMMNFLKRGDMLAFDPNELNSVSDAVFDVSDLRNIPVVGMLFQAGYLTIKDYEYGLYTLGVPDEEVRQDLSALMSGLVADKDVRWAASIGVTLRLAQWDKFFDGLAALYAGAVYGSTEGKPHELSYARCLKFLLQGQGFRVEQEVSHAGGRTDIVADHPCGTYIFELKVNKPPKVAMSQVQRRKYAAPYRAAGKPVWAVGLSFNGKTRQFKGGAAESVKCKM